MRRHRLCGIAVLALAWVGSAQIAQAFGPGGTGGHGGGAAGSGGAAGGGHAGGGFGGATGGGHMGGGFGMGGFGGGRRGGLRLHPGGTTLGVNERGRFPYPGGGGLYGGFGFGQNGDGLSDYAPYGRPIYGCDPTTPARVHPGCD